MTSGQPIPPDFGEWDFGDVSIAWSVRGRHGTIRTFHTLDELNRLIEDGDVEGRDVVSYTLDGWTLIDSIDDLEGWFWQMWQRAERGEISSWADPDREEDVTDEDSADAPTKLFPDVLLGPEEPNGAF